MINISEAEKMNKAKFWLVHITMIAILSLAFGPSAIAAPKSKAIKTATTEATGDLPTHGEEMRLDNANLEEGNADWKTGDNTPPDPEPVCTSSDTTECTAETCTGAWKDSTSTCSFF